MKKIRNLLAAMPICAALLWPVTSLAYDHDRDDRDRYYDQEHKDYHQWNADEQRYWRDYWVREKRPYIEWERANEEQRRAYWHWRHEHEHERHDHDHDGDRH
jgi:hypothetical protein